MTATEWPHDTSDAPSRRPHQEGLDQSDQEVRWCPGCGDYSILAAVQFLMPELGVRAREHRLRLRHRLLAAASRTT